MQVPGFAVVPFEFWPGPGAGEQCVDPVGRVVHGAGARRLEGAAQFGGHEAEPGRLPPGRIAPARAAQHGADRRGPRLALGRNVVASPVFARGEQVHQVHGHPDHQIHVTVEIHLTSYISASSVVTVKGSLVSYPQPGQATRRARATRQPRQAGGRACPNLTATPHVTGSSAGTASRRRACRTASTGSPHPSTRARQGPNGPTRSSSTSAAGPDRWLSGCSPGCHAPRSPAPTPTPFPHPSPPPPTATPPRS